MSVLCHFWIFSDAYFLLHGFSDGTCSGSDDTGMRFDGTGTGTEGTDSTSTDACDIRRILIFTDGYLQSENGHRVND